MFSLQMPAPWTPVKCLLIWFVGVIQNHQSQHLWRNILLRTFVVFLECENSQVAQARDGKYIRRILRSFQCGSVCKNTTKTHEANRGMQGTSSAIPCCAILPFPIMIPSPKENNLLCKCYRFPFVSVIGFLCKCYRFPPNKTIILKVVTTIEISHYFQIVCVVQ